MVGCWRGCLSGARCRLAYGPAVATATHSLSLASVKSRLVLPFWYRLPRVVPEKGALSGCVCVCVCVCVRVFHFNFGVVFSDCVVFYEDLRMCCSVCGVVAADNQRARVRCGRAQCQPPQPSTQRRPTHRARRHVSGR